MLSAGIIDRGYRIDTMIKNQNVGNHVNPINSIPRGTNPPADNKKAF
jgi:hypothetical protein